MKKNLLAYLSYEETKENLSNYHKKIKNEVCCNFNLINVSVNPYIALRKNVEIGVFNRRLTDWECEIVTKYEKNNVLEEYHPLLLDYVRQKILPSKSQDYSCDTLNVKVVVSNSSNFICASTDYAPDSTVCSKWAA